MRFPIGEGIEDPTAVDLVGPAAFPIRPLSSAFQLICARLGSPAAPSRAWRSNARWGNRVVVNAWSLCERHATSAETTTSINSRTALMNFRGGSASH